MRVRKALSLAIDRQRVVDIGHVRLRAPRRRHRAVRRLRRLARSGDRRRRLGAPRRAAAAALLDEAGCIAARDGVRQARTAAASPSTLEVVSGWSDWVRAAQVVARDLGAVGVDVSLRAYECGAWFRRLQTGEFELVDRLPVAGLSFDAPTPYDFYRWIMSARTVRPLGEMAAGNWHRFGDARADELLAQFEVTDDRRAPARAHARRSRSASSSHGARHPAVPQPGLGRVQHAPLRRLPDGGAPLRASSRRTREPEDLLVLTAAGSREGSATDGATSLRRLALYARRRLGLGHAQLRDPAPHARRPGGGAARAPARQALARGAARAARRASASPTARWRTSTSPTWRHLLRGDLGLSSPTSRRRVGEVIGTGLGWTLALAGVARRHQLRRRHAAGRARGVAARRRARLVRCRRCSRSLGAVPYFWLAMLALFVFGFGLRWFPLGHAYSLDREPACDARASSPTSLRHAVLPALTHRRWPRSAAGCSACATRCWTLLDADSIKLARAKGLPPRRIMLRYAARNALLPNVTGFGMALGLRAVGLAAHRDRLLLPGARLPARSRRCATRTTRSCRGSS